MEQKSWACTLFTQLCLCIAVYVTLNIGHPQSPGLASEQRASGSPFDNYFITVAGGFRPVGEQTLLLQQILKATKAYKARFVVDITELGGSDPLLQNATALLQLQRCPWYTTGAALRGQGNTFCLKKIEMLHGQTLDIIVLDTMLFQDMSIARGNDQILWLKRTLKESNSDWKVVIGYHELISCESNTRKMEEGKSSLFGLQDVLLSYGVEAYISSTACPRRQGGGAMGLSITGHNTMNQKLTIKDSSLETVGVDGFLLHRISSLEMATFSVKLTGEIEQKASFPQRGRTAM